MRTINSPGVQITEIDLSQTTTQVVGTNIFITGFASQGPTDEVISVTTLSEFEQIYGVPSTPAERYFYHSAKQVLNSAGNLYVTRMPYGSAAGADFSDKYSALFYPVASSGNSFTIGKPSHYSLNESEFAQLQQNDFSWSSISATAPTPTWSGSVINAGIVVINESQTIINERFEGYYVGLVDNSQFGANSDFNSIVTVNSITSNSNGVNWYNLPTTKLTVSLSGTANQNNNSISENIEKIPQFNFGDVYYSDSLVFTLFKIRASIYQPELLSVGLAESYIGSLDASKKTASNSGGVQTSFFIEDVVNDKSPNVKILVNPNISKKTSWVTASSVNPLYSVTVNSATQGLFGDGVFNSNITEQTSKVIGSVPDKLERALSLVENPEIYPLDIIADAGLTTVYANCSAGSYDDTTYYNLSTLQNPEGDYSTYYNRWSSIYNLFENFAGVQRKDCMAIVDPLRQNFINGKNTKVTSVNAYNFSQYIYTPIKNTFGNANSNYVATYANWVKAYDKTSDTQVWLPFSGFAAAIYANSDRATYPWFAPAGLTRGIVSGITDLAFNPTQKQRDFLYTISVNPVVFFPSDGYVVYGQKTLQKKPSAFDRVNVRRLFLTLEKSTMQNLKYFVFEPNTMFTRARLVNSLTPIFERAKNTEGVYDYLIVCDERNNTPDTIDANELNVDIYIKAVRSAEFILVNFIATRTSANFAELIG